MPDRLLSATRPQRGLRDHLSELWWCGARWINAGQEPQV
jgi:hypothetical protein